MSSSENLGRTEFSGERDEGLKPEIDTRGALLDAVKALLAAGPYGNADAWNAAVDQAKLAIEAAEKESTS